MDGTTRSAGLILGLPPQRDLFGPVTRHRLIRFWSLYASLFGFGTLLAQLAPQAALKAFGLGLILPGGGFLLFGGAGHLALAGLTIVVFLIALVAWFATGNVVMAPAVWFFAAVGAAIMALHHPPEPAGVLTLPGLVAASAICSAGAVAWRRRAVPRTRRLANTELARQPRPIAVAPGAATEISAFSREETLKLRFVLERALQPLQTFEGFDWRDQFQTAAVRYQLNFLGYALALAQWTRLPAFGGALDLAQRNLIEKTRDPRVWRYWELESLWGHLKRGRNPAARGNIMFSGFCATQMALFHAASGHRDFAEPGAFTLRHPTGEHFRLDLPSLVSGLRRDQEQSAFGLITCEPHWIYHLCNAIGAVAVQVQDPAAWTALAPGFRRRLEEEFIDPSGRFVACRSSLTGGFPMLGGVMPQALPSFFLNAVLPEIARRQWALARHRLLVGGRLVRRNFWPIDTGNYAFSRASAYAATMLSAVEMGDGDVARLCRAALDRECPANTDGAVSWRDKASIWSHGVELAALAGGEDVLMRMATRPRQGRDGPFLANVPFPDLIVAGAVVRSGALEAVFEPGGRPGRFSIGVAGLAPGRSYRCEGAERPTVEAGRDGTAQVHVTVAARHCLQLLPVV